MTKVLFHFGLYSWLSLCSSELAQSAISNISAIPVFVPYWKLCVSKFRLPVIYCDFQIMNGRFTFQKQLMPPKELLCCLVAVDRPDWHWLGFFCCSPGGCVLIGLSWACTSPHYRGSGRPETLDFHERVETRILVTEMTKHVYITEFSVWRQMLEPLHADLRTLHTDFQSRSWLYGALSIVMFSAIIEKQWSKC